MSISKEILDDQEIFLKFLKDKRVDEGTISILKDELFTGRTLIDVTEEQLKSLNIKLGPRIRINQIVKEIKQSFSTDVICILEESGETLNFSDSLDVDNFDAPCSTQTEELNIEELMKSHRKGLDNFDAPCSTQTEELNIEEWVKSHHKGAELLQKLKAAKHSMEDRQLLVRICCNKLIEVCGTHYPNSETKTQLAKAIVNTFPALKSSKYGQGHESFYDDKTGTGFLQFRLKTLRNFLSPERKKRKTKRSTESPPLVINGLDPCSLEEKVSWMKNINPSLANKMIIAEALDETRPNRLLEIKDPVKTATEIINRYPRLLDYSGEMIDKEFSALFPDAGDKFLVLFPAFYVPRILKYTFKHKPTLLPYVSEIDDDNLKALILLPQLLPPPNYGRGKGEKGQGKTSIKPSQTGPKNRFPNKDLILFVNVDEKLALSERQQQPFLICVKLDSGNKFFVRVEDTFIEIGHDGMRAMDVLFKLHYVLDIKFALSLEIFYNFLAGCIYCICRLKNSADALNSCLSAL